MQVDFYHLTVAPLERVLPQIAEKVLASGARLLVVEADDSRRAALDRLLWSYAADSFLPHAILGEGNDAAQPILLAADVNAANGARTIALADGEWRDDALDFDRAFHFFDEVAIGSARAAWKALVAERDGVDRRYWKQNEAGRWEQAAVSVNIVPTDDRSTRRCKSLPASCGLRAHGTLPPATRPSRPAPARPTEGYRSCALAPGDRRASLVALRPRRA